MNNLNVGDKIKVDHFLERSSEHLKKGRIKCWKKVKLHKEIEVYLVSIVTLSNGITDYDYEDGYRYKATESVKAFRVTKGLKSKPFYVLK